MSVEDAAWILQRTPAVLRAAYSDLPAQWLEASDPGEWSAHEVLRHLVSVEDHAWVERLEHALDHPGEMLPPIDRGAPDSGRSVDELIERFAQLRAANLERLTSLDFRTEAAVHAALGTVTTDQILATWAIHDLNHIAQALAAIASRYRKAVGPFIPNLGILGEPGPEFEDA